MKRVIALLAIMALVTGCAGMQTQGNQQLALTGVQLVSFNLGYFVGKDKPAADVAIRDAYTLARTGKLPPEAVAQAMAELKLNDPLLAGNCLIVLRAMGAGFLPDGQLGTISGVTPEMWDAARDGYIQGFAVGTSANKKTASINYDELIAEIEPAAQRATARTGI